MPRSVRLIFSHGSSMRPRAQGNSCHALEVNGALAVGCKQRSRAGVVNHPWPILAGLRSVASASQTSDHLQHLTETACLRSAIQPALDTFYLTPQSALKGSMS